MPRRIVANSFVSGEISPELYGRHDLKAYFNGAASLENFIVRRTGGIRKRAGTEVLYTLDSSISPDTDTQDNKFAIFSYFFDSDTFGLLVFRLNTSGTVQTKLIIREDESDTITDWSDITVNTGITATTDFDDLQCKQVGDTLFFTRIGYQAFSCRITMADRTTEFSMFDNSITVPIPDAMEGVWSWVIDADTQDITKYYALYGVKDGVMSKPSTLEVAAKTPWLSGSKITITGTLDFEKHDYYILAKKSGMNYGKISEIYPVEMTDEVPETYDDGIMTFRGDTAAFNDNGPAFFSGDPNKTSQDKPTIYMTPRCLGVKTEEYDDGGTPTYRFATPHFLVDFGAASSKDAYINLRPDVVKMPDMTAHNLALSGDYVVTPFYYPDSGASPITLMSPQTITLSSAGTLIVPLGTMSGETRIGFIIESTNENYHGDSAFISGVAFISGTTYYDATDADMEAPVALAADPNYDLVSCEKSIVGKYGADGDIYSTMWNDADPIDLIRPSATEWTQTYTKARENMTIPTAAVFHTNGALIEEIEFSVPEANKTLSTIQLYIGANALNWGDGNVADIEDVQYVTATLSTFDAVWGEVGKFNVQAGYIDTQKLTIDYPSEVPANTKYKLTFSEPIRLRGINCFAINTALEFVDDNIVPGEVTGQQTMLTVGDNNVDCGSFDIFEQRTVFAASNNLPFTLWFSVVGDLYNFYAYRPQGDDDAFSVTIPAKRASGIRHILAEKNLMLFTEDGVYVVDSGSSGSGFSYSTVRMRKVCNAAASKEVQPIHLEGKTLFVGEDGRTVYELKYDLMQDEIIPTDKSVLAYHLTEGAQIIKIAYQRYPDSIVWFLLDDGSLLAMTYMPEHEVAAWSHHSIGGTSSQFKIIDIMEIGSEVVEDDVDTTSDILLIYETFDESGDRDSKTIIERMRPNMCADSLSSGSDEAACTDHLGGTSPATETDVNATLVTLMPETQEFSTQGIPKNVKDVCLRVRRCGEVSVVAYQSGLTAYEKDMSTESGGNLALYTGDFKIMPAGYVNDMGQMSIQSSDEKPCEILSIVYTLDIPR